MMARGNIELPARAVAHARGARHVAGVVEGQHLVVVLRLVEVQLALLDQVVGELADVLRHRVARIQEVQGAGQRVEEAVGDAPGMAALAEDDALDPEVERRLADALTRSGACSRRNR